MIRYFGVFVCLFSLFNIGYLNAQATLPKGNYVSEVCDITVLNDSIINFKFNYGTCLTTLFFGKGQYVIEDTILTVYPFLSPEIDTSEYYSIQPIQNKNKIILEFSKKEDLQHLKVQIKGNSKTYLDTTYTTPFDSFIQVIDVYPDSNAKYITIGSFLSSFHYEYPLKSLMGKHIKFKLSSHRKLTESFIQFVIKDTTEVSTFMGPYLGGIEKHYKSIEDEKNEVWYRRTKLGFKRKMIGNKGHSHVPKPVRFKIDL